MKKHRLGRVGAKVMIEGVRTTIVLTLPTLAPGAVKVDPPVNGVAYWNMDDVTYVKGKG